jgi:dipeptidyl aminopeptidase/acylaminoacyl peptidase
MQKGLAKLLFVACLWCILAVRYGAGAQKPGGLSVADSLNVHSFSQLIPMRFSPDGKWLAYTVKDNQKTEPLDVEMWVRTGVRGFYTGTDVWIVNIKTGETKKLTSGHGANWLPTWSPDGHYLAFLSDRNGRGQANLWIWDSVKGDSRKLADIDVRADQIEWTPDGSKVLVTTLPQGLSLEDYARRLMPGAEGEEPKLAGVSGSSVVLYRGNLVAKGASQSDPWNLDTMLRDIASVDVPGGRIEFLVKGQRIAKYFPSPDGSRVAYTVPRRFEKPGSQQIVYDLATISLRTMEVRVVAADIRLGFSGEFSWSPGGSMLAYRAFGMEEKNNDCYIVGVDGGASRNVSMLPPQDTSAHSSERVLWDPEGKHLFFINDGVLWRASVDRNESAGIGGVPGRTIVQMISRSNNMLWTPDGGGSTVVLTHDSLGKQDGFYRVDLAGRGATKLFEQGQCFTCTNLMEGQFTSVSRDGQHLAYFAEDAQHDSDLWVGDAGFATQKRLTHLNPQFDQYKMGAARLVDWWSDDGERLRGTLLLPPDYMEGRRYPLIVLVYGGASLSDFFDHFGWYGFNLQLFATRGYAVLLPDCPQRLGTPMLDLAKTVLPGVNRVIEMGIADPERLGVMGHSYGGYSTLSLIVQTARFKAAIEADGPGDLAALYGEMDQTGAAYGTALVELGQGLMGGTPWQFRDRYIENSPFFYLDRVETPLLIVHGSRDRAVGAFLGDQVFVGLRRLGKEVEYARYTGEDHSPMYWRYGNQLDLVQRMIEWFDKHLKGEAPDTIPLREGLQRAWRPQCTSKD